MTSPRWPAHHVPHPQGVRHHDHPHLTDLLDRYATLRDTILGLEAERDQLGAELKAALLDGETVQTDLYRAELRTSTTIEYPWTASGRASGTRPRWRSPPSTARRPIVSPRPGIWTRTRSPTSP